MSGQKPAGTLVGRLVTIDPNPLDTFTYQLVAGTGATNNASFTIAGDQVWTAAVLNRAVTPTVSLRVRTTDSSGATFEKAIVLPVMAPPAITRQPDPRRVFAGDPVVFAVEATGLEPLAFQWKKNGANLAGANSRILDGDGVVELLEYAFGGDPKSPDAANLPAAVDEGGYLTVTLTKRPGVTFLVETSPDLQAASWSAANTTVLIDNSITLKVRDNVLIGASPGRYLRVRVTVP